MTVSEIDASARAFAAEINDGHDGVAATTSQRPCASRRHRGVSTLLEQQPTGDPASRDPRPRACARRVARNRRARARRCDRNDCRPRQPGVFRTASTRSPTHSRPAARASCAPADLHTRPEEFRMRQAWATTSARNHSRVADLYRRPPRTRPGRRIRPRPTDGAHALVSRGGPPWSIIELRRSPLPGQSAVVAPIAASVTHPTARPDDRDGSGGANDPRKAAGRSLVAAPRRRRDVESATSRGPG